MTVAVEQGLERVGDFLQGAGYRVISLTAMTGLVDAVVYRCNLPEQILFGTTGTDNVHGIFMVNANDKTPEQIDTILRSRVYSPLL